MVPYAKGVSFGEDMGKRAKGYEHALLVERFEGYGFIGP